MKEESFGAGTAINTAQLSIIIQTSKGLGVDGRRHSKIRDAAAPV
jgi:hypothetical protein